MRKRIIGILLIVVLVASVLSGCLGVNTERDMKQVVSTVNYKGKTATVSKLEVLEVYAQNVQTYVSYYGMTEREVFDYFLDQLSVRKLLVLDAADRNLCDWDNGNMKIDAESLTIAQRNEAQDAVNTQLKSLFDEYVEIVTDEYSKDSETSGSGSSGSSGSESGTEDEDEDTRTVRPLPTVEEDEKEFSNTELNVESWMQNFEYANNIERIAFKRLEKLLKDQFKDEEYLLQAQYQMLVIKALQDTLYGSVNVTDAQVWDKFASDRTKQIEEFNANKSAYTSAINNNQIVYYHPEIKNKEDNVVKYGTVKHILLSFEDASADLKTELKHVYFDGDYSKAEFDRRVASKLYTDEQIKAYRTAMLQNLKIRDFGDFADWWATYDKDASNDLIDWRDAKYDATTTPIINANGFFDNVETAIDGKTETKDKIAKFVDYIFGYNSASETGMFNNENDYVVEPDGSKYMDEFQALSEYLIYGVEIPDELKEYCNASAYGHIGDIGICVTDYGVHVVMVTNIFEDTQFASATNAESLKSIIIDHEDGDNLYDYIKDSLVAAEKNNVMTSYQSNFIDIHGESSITLNEGVINAIFR